MLSVENLCCERDHRQLYEDLSFVVNKGELLQVEGANGSGKTTLLRILCGLFEEYAGKIHWSEEPCFMYLGHAPGIKLRLTAAENLHWLATLAGDHEVDSAVLFAALHAVGLRGFEDVLCHSLSEGQRKRVNLARLAFVSAGVWILDEPFSSLDSSGTDWVLEQVDKQVSADGLVILTSHQPVTAAAKRIRLGS